MFDFSSLELLSETTKLAVAITEAKADQIRNEAITRLAEKYVNEVCPSIKAVRSIFNRTGIRSGKIPITTYDRLDYFSVDLISSTQVFDLKGRMNGVYACFSNVKDCVSRFQQYDDGSLSDIAELVNHWDEYYAPCIEKSVNRIVTAKMAEQMDKADKKLHEAIELKGVVQA